MIGAPHPALPTDAQQWVDDHDAGSWVNTAEIAKYRNLIVGAPLIAKAMDYAAMDAALRTGTNGIWEAIDAAITNGSVADISNPADYANQSAGTILTSAEAMITHSAKIAHALMLEIEGTVPWSITGYSETNLRYLLDGDELYYVWDPTGATTQFAKCVDHSPSRMYGVAAANYGPANSHAHALVNLTENVCQDYTHSTVGDPTYAATIDDSETDNIARGGCHHMSPILANLMRSINIPARELLGYWAADSGGHSNAAFPTAGVGGVGAVLDHGDNVYGYGLDMPGLTRFTDYDWYVANVLPLTPHPPVNQALGDLTVGAFYDNVFEYPGTNTKADFASPTKGWQAIETAMWSVTTSGERFTRYNDMVTLTGVDGLPDKPNATNTGTSGALTPTSGRTISAPNTTITDETITGTMTIAATNARFFNCRLDGGAAEALIVNAGQTLCQLYDCEVTGTGTTPLIVGSPLRVNSCYVHTTAGSGINANNAPGSVLIESCYFDTEDRALWINADAQDVRAHYNTLNTSDTTDDVVVVVTAGTASIHRNWIDGGKDSILNLPSSGTSVTGNKFGRAAASGLLTETGALDEWAFNVYEDDSSTANKTDTAPL